MLFQSTTKNAGVRSVSAFDQLPAVVFFTGPRTCHLYCRLHPYLENSQLGKSFPMLHPVSPLLFGPGFLLHPTDCSTVLLSAGRKKWNGS